MPSFPPYEPEAVDRARRLRRDMTFPERLLWSRLRRRSTGVRFRRQHPVGPFIVDFYSPAANLVIEVDGRSHEGRERRDALRERFLNESGLHVMRVTNDEVLEDPDAVATWIAEEVARRLGPRLDA